VGDVWSSPAVQEVPIDCNVSGNNDGCEKTVACPSGTKIRGAVAACNLEYGLVTDDQVSSVAQGYIKVVRASDHVDEGGCWVGGNRLDSGQEAIANVAALTAVTIGCQEHDKNGGDCDIRGFLYCQ
jgi:hypothetical protein